MTQDERGPVIESWKRWRSATFNGAAIIARLPHHLGAESVEIPGAVCADCVDRGDGTVEMLLIAEDLHPLQRAAVEKRLMEILQSGLGQRP
ncbi:MAG: hypothetical protein IT554_08565 [Sphingomonadaceae bacterium]|nr:hypothetical protein [Sphingomonadaceae bacterium]